MGPMGRPPGGGRARFDRAAQNSSMGLQAPHQEIDLEKMDEESEQMLILRYLDQDNAAFTRTEGGFLDLKTDGKLYQKVQVVRMFPNTDKNRYLSVREGTERAREIGVINDLKKDFDRATGRAIEEQLNVRYFTPVITKLLSVKEESGYAYFVVMTDYGECRFAFRTNNNAVVKLSENRIFIQDLENNRFEIPDIRKLSVKEQRKLDMFL